MAGRHLNKLEREAWQARLEMAMSPASMNSAVEELTGILRAHMFVQAGLAFVRDAWTAGKFAQARGADLVRLWPGERPDCELTFGGSRELFEIVEADQPGRRRTEEYRALIARSEAGEIEEPEFDEDWHFRAAMAPDMLESAARSKAAKGYSDETSLIIHLNLMEYGFARREIEAAMQARTAHAKNAFKEVWVLWQRTAYPLWRRGEAVPKEAWPKRDIDEEDRRISDAEIFRSALEDDQTGEAEINPEERHL